MVQNNAVLCGSGDAEARLSTESESAAPLQD